MIIKNLDLSLEKNVIMSFICSLDRIDFFKFNLSNDLKLIPSLKFFFKYFLSVVDLHSAT